ncbi:hypothetical protein [Lusitaniella coriacea]|uniref:hypothetical protein n=1 Tax=Lusitaniella coriacea TaxID=1983105 RepID=UPI003CEC1969
MNTIYKWVAVGVAEILLSLTLLAIAPMFLNSDKPAIGFAIWLGVPTMLGSSGLYAALRLKDAQKARQLAIAKCPEYSHLKIVDFLNYSSAQVAQSIEMYEVLQEDPDLNTLNISLLNLLEKPNNDEN